MKIHSVLTIGLLLVLLGCSRLTLDNYNRIAMGMHYDEVIELIGSPRKCDDVMGVRSCEWGDDERSVQVNFVAGQVLIFSSRNLK